ncbi:1-deoxy-D-xylulose-5-phosphate synthase [Ignatzschineria cameli]|uniref:1-deoxy-D-xylulose-5-phosphate synthase n=1 Tax=Ignatzschineria cameli TaxID=2182793 RepID=A0A2U2AL27_9GAMM|nr:1-deoxy-D-xylulose-5-phosphate synthase [Ignatzschineria cameli]PWD83911.1 1-deoxy-D-xylulose-5-phosphate synthase [Ignatzschineria cameli]PWD85441.1 1-deoxy-D-xylulose-5-phosphate synthase [Ignatzschineria cameli]PWD88846.1 1-deoxy-D-xylulose-5-phosphate synthase [Ignatzschineria cameli]PWD90236.1 1-deoxy-D-xylulose-5-phosphate synthase [Ignatzschineria cameli]PWD90731.1 1-deoxy-D-xylulose-5-phosphate synthase [Ignatzschineria cameli]
MNPTPLLDQIVSPDDLKSLSLNDLETLSTELRQFLIGSVLDSGGHFASGLGVVELTVALHHVFNTPHDKIIWDVGHQAYPHKILTGRKDRIHTIRKKGGLGPFPSLSESDYDAFGVGHSSTSISAALGMAIGAKHHHDNTQQLIAVIGDGALTAGQAFEALNHAGDLKANLLVILNDNNMSISPNVGALSTMLTRTLSKPAIQSIRESGAKFLENLPFPQALDLAKRAETRVKSAVAEQSIIFEEFGFQYFGPIDGHDLPTLIATLKNLKQKSGPRFLHITTKKGKGYAKAEAEPVKFHAVSAAKKAPQGVTSTDKAQSAKQAENAVSKKASGLTYTQVFSQWLCDMAEIEPDLMAITPAMCEGSGLVTFSQRFPHRFFDTAIAEQHAVTLGAGMALGGIKPVVAIYSTFLQRAYDQLIHDVAIQNLDVTFAIDRAGIVGPDGATHAGTFDIAYLRTIPNMVIMAPSSEEECYKMLTTAYHYPGPAAVRYPRGKGIGSHISDQPTATIEIGKSQLLKKGDNLLVINVGPLITESTAVAEHFGATLLDLRFVKPLDQEMLLKLAQSHKAIITIEDGAIMGGAGSAINELLATNGIFMPIKHFGIKDYYPEHGEREEILADYGLTAEKMISEIDHFLNLVPSAS